MKKKIFSVLLCITMLTCSLTGCGAEDDSSVDSTVEQSQSIEYETTEIPIEIKNKLQAARDSEPIMIPADEWTIDTVCSVTYINGEKMSIPCTLRDLGDGFEIMEDEDHEFYFKEESRSANGYLSYYGKEVAGFSVKDCQSVDDVYDSPLNSLLFINRNGSDNVFPISVNGVTIGDASDLMIDRLFFMNKSESLWDEEKHTYSMHYDVDNLHIDCICKENSVFQISIKVF